MRIRSRIYVIRKKYLLLTAVIIITCILFLTLLNLNTQLNVKRQDQQTSLTYQKLEEMTGIKNNMSGFFSKQEREKVYLIGEDMDELSRVLSLLKYAPVESANMLEITKEAAENWVIIDGAVFQEERKLKDFVELAGEVSGNIIIYHLDKMDLQNEMLRTLFGIKKAGELKDYKGIRLLNGFWTDVALEEKDYSYQALDLELSAGRPVYVTGYAEDYEMEKVVPLVFRNIYGKSAIYGVNGSLMDVIPHGIIRGIFSQKGSAYMYPIIDASFVAIAPLPLLSEENGQVLQKEYLRSMKQIMENILLPDIRMLCMNMGQKPTIYARDYLRDGNTKFHPEILPRFLMEVDKWDGELGICFEEKNQARWEEWVKEYLENNRIYSVMTKDIGLEPAFMKGLTGFIHFDQESILPVGYETDHKVRMDIILDLLKDSGQMQLNYWASLFGYGLSSIGMDLEHFYYPKDTKWNTEYKNVSKRLQNTLYQVKLLQPATVGEATIRAAGYGLMEARITYKDTEILIDIDYFVDPAKFMLRTEKKIVDVINGSFREVGEGYYIVEANKASATVKLESGWQEFNMYHP